MHSHPIPIYCRRSIICRIIPHLRPHERYHGGWLLLRAYRLICSGKPIPSLLVGRLVGDVTTAARLTDCRHVCQIEDVLKLLAPPGAAVNLSGANKAVAHEASPAPRPRPLLCYASSEQRPTASQPPARPPPSSLVIAPNNVRDASLLRPPCIKPARVCVTQNSPCTPTAIISYRQLVTWPTAIISYRQLVTWPGSKA